MSLGIDSTIEVIKNPIPLDYTGLMSIYIMHCLS